MFSLFVIVCTQIVPIITAFGILKHKVFFQIYFVGGVGGAY